MDNGEQEYDDLTRLKGIGEKRQAWLREEMNICRFVDLAETSADSLQKQLQAINQPISINTVNGWIEQAQKIAKKTAPFQARTSVAVNDFRQHYATFTVELLIDEEKNVRRTRVTYVQNKTEETWPGWQENRLSDFFVQSAGLHLPEVDSVLQKVPVSPQKSSLFFKDETSPGQTSIAPQSESLSKPKPKDSLDGTLRVSTLEILPVDSIAPQHIIHANEAFNVRILLNLTGLIVTPSRLLNCAVTVWAKKHGKGERQIIGEYQDTFMPVEKTLCVVESTIPVQGIYRLEAIVTITPEQTSPSPHSTIRGWFESGPIQVF